MKRVFLAFLLVPSLCKAQTPTVAPTNAPAHVVVTPAQEPGIPLIISGVVYAEDGRTPLRGASVYVYQTDARGYYAPDNPRASDAPRLRGYMRTDANGRYEFRTVRPGSYPGTRNPGHIHYHVSAPNYRERVFEIVFDDDPQIPEQWRRDAARADAFVAIIRLAGDSAKELRGGAEYYAACTVVLPGRTSGDEALSVAGGLRLARFSAIFQLRQISALRE